MTLTPKFSWRQTSSKLILILNLHKNSSKDVEIIFAESYLKVSFPRYCLELFLLHKVEEDSTVTRFNRKELEVILTKCTSDETDQEWKSLERVVHKQDAVNERRVALDLHHQKIKQNYTCVKEKTVSLDKDCILKQIEVEELQQQFVEEKKDQILNQYLQENHITADNTAESPTKSLSTILPTRGSRRVSEDREYDGDGEDHYSSSEHLGNVLTIGDNINPCVVRKARRFIPKRNNTSSVNSDEEANSKKDTSQRHVGKKNPKKTSNHKSEIRSSKTIAVTYSSRPGRLPARVSRDGHVFETEQGEHLNTGDIDVQKLFDQAKDQFEESLFGECISTYNKVILIVPDSVKALSNRAAAYLANASHSLALSDTNQALSIIDSQSPQTESRSKLLCLIRRGAAHSALGKISEALQDYEEALALQPHNTSLQRDCCNIRRAMETSEGSSWVETEGEESTF